MIRQQAFENKSIKMLKGALHAHTTRSDGVDTPEETIKYHYDRGYDFMMLSDHAVYNKKGDFCPDIPLTIIPGAEIDAGISDCSMPDGNRHFDALCIGPISADSVPFEQDQPISASVEYDSFEEYQAYLDSLHQRGMITCISHPQRDYTPPRYLERIKGHFAMEIYNSASDIEYDLDADAPFWDEMIDNGIRLYGIACDDDEGYYYSCHAWVMVNAENNPLSIMNALNNGEFYSSCGPEIYDFYVHGNKVVVDCSPVETIYIHCAKHPNDRVFEPGKEITHGEFWINDSYPYVRISVVDKNGKKAWTNPIYLDDRGK
ncbi:MAG: hypothetical protein IKV40_00840 [Clostridia bacterium]|nr:hypothetical protein [Clostridia bacterium]